VKLFNCFEPDIPPTETFTEIQKIPQPDTGIDTAGSTCLHSGTAVNAIVYDKTGVSS